ncbi:Uncharacterised protein [Orientia tsutsugamushi]|uniref:Uncharacterized protein n=1 Tax=Orientia tsutsugamushi TaxID=784 RepID=A0A2U3RP85_ORITS|nr:Uncharacterised protein [Orientia tsutsugamushi]
MKFGKFIHLNLNIAKPDSSKLLQACMFILYYDQGAY